MIFFYIILVQLLITSCSAQKVEDDVINHFLDIENASMQYDSIYLQQQPLNVRDAIKLYELAYKRQNDQNSSSAEVWTFPEIKEWPFSEEEINTIEENLKQKEIDWRKGDFKNKDFVLKSNDVLEDKKFKTSRLGRGKDYILKLSHPILNKKETYALFQYNLSELIMGGSPGTHRGAIIMKKEGNKWVIFSSIREAVYE